MYYILHMIAIRQTSQFRLWLSDLRDRDARSRINTRLRRIEIGNIGDVKSVGGGVSEIRINHGAGYRLYYTQRGTELIVLLCGGDKSSQIRDIKNAKILVKDI